MPLTTERSKVAHLLRRAGFGGTEAELDEYASLGFAGALERVLNYEQVDNTVLDQRLASLSLDLTKIEDARVHWLNRMLYTRRPFEEKMALFWHDHFATASSKVGDAALMLRQISLFRQHATGNFETLLREVTRDPAMLIWLDNRLNRKGAPNENYAREVMELFTVGIGNYTEQDIKEAARAFTGYTLNKDKQFAFNRNGHDNGNKTFMGETKNWDADDILARLVRHPATARYLTARLFRFFVHASPEPASIDRLAATLLSSGFSVKAVMRDMFAGPEFLSPQAFHGLVKSPVELVLGSLKALNVVNIGPDLAQNTRRMGQDVLNPPDVNGWTGGEAWVNATTLFHRFNFANRLATGRVANRPYFADVAGTVRSSNLTSAEQVVDYYLNLLADGDATSEARQVLIDYLNDGKPFAPDEASLDRKVRGMVHLAMSLPSYQLA